MTDYSTFVTRTRSELGDDVVSTDHADLTLASMDIYSSGPLPLAVLRPGNVAELSRAVAMACSSGLSVVPRGGAASYTGGVVPQSAETVVVETTRMNQIIEIDDKNMFVTVEAGCTWQHLWETLGDRGLRVPFWGPLSGSVATVGGSVSQQAVLWGSGRYGPSGESVLGLDVVVADGSVIKTGMASVGAVPNWRHFGPDLTGLFLADCGVLGVKASITLRLIPMPNEVRFASFTFEDAESFIEAMTEIARNGLAVSGFGLDPVLTDQRVRRGSLAQGAEAARAMVGQSSNKLAALKKAVRMAAQGRDFLGSANYTLHLMTEGRSAAAVDADLAAIGKVCAAGTAVEDTVPRLLYSRPYGSLTSALGPEGQRWAPLHVLAPLGSGWEMLQATQALIQQRAEEMSAAGVEIGFMFGTVSNTTLLIELVMTWPGPRSTYYDSRIPAAKLRRYPVYDNHPEADELVSVLRDELVDLFADSGGAHLQIGRRYRYLDRLAPETRDLLIDLKRSVDPNGLLNPGALGLG